jgi:hypothetical protein
MMHCLVGAFAHTARCYTGGGCSGVPKSVKGTRQSFAAMGAAGEIEGRRRAKALGYNYEARLRGLDERFSPRRRASYSIACGFSRPAWECVRYPL